jgi:hypothetical protein
VSSAGIERGRARRNGRRQRADLLGVDLIAVVAVLLLEFLEGADVEIVEDALVELTTVLGEERRELLGNLDATAVLAAPAVTVVALVPAVVGRVGRVGRLIGVARLLGR